MMTPVISATSDATDPIARVKELPFLLGDGAIQHATVVVGCAVLYINGISSTAAPATALAMGASKRQRCRGRR